MNDFIIKEISWGLYKNSEVSYYSIRIVIRESKLFNTGLGKLNKRVD
jgi:hypothetical protein